MNNINLTPILQAIIALLAALITYRLVPWIKSRTNESQQGFIQAMVKSLVFAAEQIYGAGNGQDKMRYVRDKLLAAGFDVDTDVIEAAVGEYINRYKIFGEVMASAVHAEEDEEPAETEITEEAPEAAEETDAPEAEAEPEAAEGDAPGDNEAPPDDAEGAKEE